MAGESKAALVIVHPSCMWGKDTQKDKRERPKRIEPMNRIWEIFKDEGSPRIAFWDPYTDKRGDWSPVVRQDLNSKYVIPTDKEGSSLPGPGKAKLRAVIEELETAGIRDILFIGGYQMCCMRGIIDYFFPRFRCWIVWDICPSKGPRELDLEDYEILREANPEHLKRIDSERIQTVRDLKRLVRIKPRT